MRGGEEGAPVTRPVDVLDPAPPKGCSCVERLTIVTKLLTIVKLQAIRGVPPRATVSRICCNLDKLGSMLVQVGRLVGHVRPSCPTWLLLGFNLVHLCSNLVQLCANLAHFAPNLAPRWVNLGPTWIKLAPT